MFCVPLLQLYSYVDLHERVYQPAPLVRPLVSVPEELIPILVFATTVSVLVSCSLNVLLSVHKTSLTIISSVPAVIFVFLNTILIK